MLQFIIELPESTSLKEKRHVVNSLKHRMIRRYKVSAAEVDLHQSLAFAQIGVAVVSNFDVGRKTRGACRGAGYLVNPTATL
jgi:uncharacterized protein YlxP (DUF503 family)